MQVSKCCNANIRLDGYPDCATEVCNRCGYDCEKWDERRGRILRHLARALWATYDDTHGYAQEKIERVTDTLEPFIVRQMFDPRNQHLLDRLEEMSELLAEVIDERV